MDGAHISLVTAMKVELEQEIGMDDVRRQLHNESVMAQMKQIEDDVKNTIQPPLPAHRLRMTKNRTQPTTHRLPTP